MRSRAAKHVLAGRTALAEDGGSDAAPTSSGSDENAGPEAAPARQVLAGDGADAAERRPAGRLLVIEDEPGIVDFLRRGLEAEGFEVEAVLDGAEGERLALRGGFDAIVLDLMLPGRSGMEVLSALRTAMPSLPVIVLTARGEIEDRVAGLEAGAVDYLVKPFSMAELVARVRAHLRVIAEVSTSALQAEDIEVDLLTRKVRRGERDVLLSTTEFELLTFLMRHHGQVVSREAILSSVWGYEHDPATNVVDVYVGYLRRKLGAPDHPAPIQTVRAVGYRLGPAG
jgi:two-component system, OmpR family, copper resistance phosphate regulon response regulator CusR